MLTTVCVVSASRQNVFFAELLDALAGEIEAHGVVVERSVDCFPELRDGLVYAFVPHELLPMIMPDAHPSEAQLRRSVTICTEQPGTTWFEENARISERAAASVDISRLGVTALRRRGVRARLLQLGYIARWDTWHGDARHQRSIDVTLLAGDTSRRLEAVAACGWQLARRRTELHLAESLVPHQPESRGFVSGDRKWRLLRDSKLLLNVHRSELAYFEWQRGVEAMINGCVLLSEHALGFEPLVPGEHFVSISLGSFPAALAGLLEEPDHLSRIRTSAYEFLRDEHPLSRAVEVLLEATAEAAAAPLPAKKRSRNVSPRPNPPRLPPTEYERVAQQRSDLDVLRMATKQLLLEQRMLSRRVQDLHASISAAPVRGDVVERLGSEPAVNTRVSVVLTVYNYAALVAEAIDSVAASDLREIELVVVDDASTDGSGAEIRRALGRAPWLAATLVTRGSNRGLAQARNLGAETASSELVFMLDADNAIYPRALSRLLAAMGEIPGATFAYGMIEQFGSDANGLLSYLPWDPLRLRYGNFIDAMAMVRRDRLLAVGGYTVDPRLYGWEDFALWCAFAERGWSGVRIPEVLARYRVSAHSMISLTNIDASVAWSVLLSRYPFLAAPPVAQSA